MPPGLWLDRSFTGGEGILPPEEIFCGCKAAEEKIGLLSKKILGPPCRTPPPPVVRPEGGGNGTVPLGLYEDDLGEDGKR